ATASTSGQRDCASVRWLAWAGSAEEGGNAPTMAGDAMTTLTYPQIYAGWPSLASPSRVTPRTRPGPRRPMSDAACSPLLHSLGVHQQERHPDPGARPAIVASEPQGTHGDEFGAFEASGREGQVVGDRVGRGLIGNLAHQNRGRTAEAPRLDQRASALQLAEACHFLGDGRSE